MARLARAVEAPPVSWQEFADRVLTKSWIEATVQKANEGEKEIPESFLKDPAELRRVIGNALADFHSDDYPHVEVELTMDSGRTILASSGSQSPFMVPWTVMRKAGEAATWNPEIGPALADLLPSDFTNRKRLLADDAWLRDQAVWFLVRDWEAKAHAK